MTTLPTAADVLPDPSPIIGSAEEFEAAAGFAADLDARFRQAEREFEGAAGELSQQHSRHTNEMVRRLRTTVISGCQLSGDTAAEGRRALLRHADAVAQTHREARAVIESVETGIAHMAGASQTLSEVATELGCSCELSWREPAPPVPPVGAPAAGRGAALGVGPLVLESGRSGVLEARWRGAAAVWNDAIEMMAIAVRRWERLVEERREAERTLVASLSRTALGALILQGDSHTTRENAVSATVAGFSSGRVLLGSEAFAALVGGTLAPTEAARVWNEIVATRSAEEVNALIDEHCCELASVDGIPFWVMNRAARAVLAFALETGLGERRQRGRLAEVAARMGFTPREIDLRQFGEELSGIRRDLERAERAGGGEVQLLDLGRHDGALTAAVSFGNLDRASRVGVLVSGMKSDVSGIEDAFKAFSRIRKGDPGIGMVTWVGYRSPGLLEEPFQARASAGRLSLASFLDGLSAARVDEPPLRTVLIGHSYGSNTAAEALKITREPIDAFVTMGSAGLKPGTVTEQLHAREIYATHAAQDRIAPIGMSLHLSEPGPRVDPRNLDGVRVLSAEESAGGRAVSSHPLNPGSSNSVGGQARERIGYLDPTSRTVHELSRVLENNVKE
ncbi:hypothetical protein K8P10_002239 [Leucobacter sp. Psy1]|uniref:alpha/beta hydrolase n=1 Tax=Leucobacter sp. Psy1 TaxID=2875729 RepID=UPI001CD1F2C8|nr:alpha/beta hydrolase [Leucobacter sp. Psy1]UBH06728.1 hypothetical protein K8P10_002239 [Leucobacter sp. Psy1]